MEPERPPKRCHKFIVPSSGGKSPNSPSSVRARSGLGESGWQLAASAYRQRWHCSRLRSCRRTEPVSLDPEFDIYTHTNLNRTSSERALHTVRSVGLTRRERAVAHHRPAPSSRRLFCRIDFQNEPSFASSSSVISFAFSRATETA